ncbi:hypothetical protein CFLV_09435 [Corynebacterium flavescens]|uniref:Uncharacterized protein n=2 Tax=Corynebacterium flavescens TaxID=28028 RepID=A0A1L7CNG5_CORFL|nr:hypothetical protein CFLV_09435 [Corynebacterium flavescens]KAA8720556.1 hypothetical protein F4V60_09195 [Corynebacterium flavescens]
MVSSMSEKLATLWFTHEVELQGEEIRTARGVTYGPPTVVKASINMQSRTVAGGSDIQNEVVVAGTLNWSADGPIPAVGSVVTLPAKFGAKRQREVVTARLADTGTGLTPDHVEVTIQ